MQETTPTSGPGPADAQTEPRNDTKQRPGPLKTGALHDAILRSTNFSSIATDERGVIQVFNVGAERMLGYAAGDVLNRVTPADIADADDMAQRALALGAEYGLPIAAGFEALVFKASRGIEDIYELTYVCKDGARLPTVVSVTALRDAQELIIGYLLIGTDNTARKRAEAERQALDRRLSEVVQNNHRELQDARIAADRANQAKSDFLSSMSHELRSPLNAILGFAQLMDSGTPPPTPAQKDSIDQILQAGWYLLTLINEILDLSLIESGQLSLSTEPMGLAEVLADCRAMIEPHASKSDIGLDFKVPGSLLFVRADRTRVKQVFVNLLSNAIKYNRPGGTVELTCTVLGPRVRISVRDTGHGLSEEKLGQLFQPFNRLGQETGFEEGTGIGLVVCKRLVELMHGQIGVTSTEGVGSVFWVELEAAMAPEIADPADEVAADAEVLKQHEQPDTAQRTVLYVEDNPANLLLVARLLARRGDLRLISAKDGRSGVELARTEQPDIILMDINLPGISGVTALQMLCGDPTTAHIPVIALSANAMPQDIERGLAAGFFRYLTKPIKLGEFMHTLDLALEHAEAYVEQGR